MHLEKHTIEQSTVEVSIPQSETKLCMLPGCPKPVSMSRTGRPKKFCSPAHKHRWHRARRSGCRDDVGRSFPKPKDKFSRGYIPCPSDVHLPTTPYVESNRRIEQRYAQPTVLGKVEAHIEATKKGKPEVQFDRHPAPDIKAAIHKDEFGRQFLGDRFIPRRPRRKKAA